MWISQTVADFQFSIFKDCGYPPSWIFESSKFLLPIRYGGPICVIVRNFMWIGQTLAEICPIFGFQNETTHYFGFLKVWNFNCRSDSEGQIASPCQISCQVVKRRGDNGRFSIFQDGGRRPSAWIIRSWKFYLLIRRDKLCNKPNFVRKPLPRYGWFLIFQDAVFQCPPSWIFNSSKIYLLVRFGGPKCIIRG